MARGTITKRVVGQQVRRHLEQGEVIHLRSETVAQPAGEHAAYAEAGTTDMEPFTVTEPWGNRGDREAFAVIG